MCICYLKLLMCEKVIKNILNRSKFGNFQTGPPSFVSTLTGIGMTSFKCNELKTKKTSNKLRKNRYKNVQLHGLWKFKIGNIFCIIVISFRKTATKINSQWL